MSNHRINQRITRSEKFYNISWKAQLTYLLGFAFLDDYGVWTADPHEVWRELFVDHKGIREKDMINILEELAEVKLIKLYAIGGKLYQQYENFNTFQVFGQGYNKKSAYPTFEECDVDVEHNESNSCNWVYSGVKGCLRVYLGVSPHSLSHSNSPSPSNTNSNENSSLEEKPKPLTPLQEMKLFLTSDEYFKKIVEYLVEKGFPEDATIKELNNFKDYWTEQTKNGMRQRWELQSTFQLKRRLTTWFNNTGKFNKTSGQKSKPIYNTLTNN